MSDWQSLFEGTSLAPRAGTPPPGEIGGSLDLSEGGLLSPLWYGLDLLNRPARAISEGLGAARSDSDVLEAMLRGFQGEYKFGTVGEQLLPVSVGADYDAAEEWMKKAARLGIDIATDPFTALTFGPGKRLVGAGLRGLSAAKKKAGIKMPQWTAIGLFPSVTVFRKYGGKPGETIAKGVDRGYVDAKRWTGESEAGFADVLKRLGLHTRKSKAMRIDANDWVEMGTQRIGIEPPDPKVGGLATWISGELQRIGKIVENFKDVDKQGFKVLHPGLEAAQKRIKDMTGKLGLASTKSKKLRDSVWKAFSKGEEVEGEAAKKLHKALNKELKGYSYGTFDFSAGPSVWAGETFYKRPFKMLEDYTPNMLKEEVIHMIGTEKGFSKAVKMLAEANGISEVKAAEILRKFGSPAIAGNLEYAREFKLPGAWKETDPLKYLPRYFQRAYSRIAFGKEFALSGRVLDDLIKGAVAEGLDPKFALDFANVAKGKMPRNAALDSIARKVMGVQVVTKMGPLSSLANLSQNINTIVRDGGINFTKGILRSFSNEGKRAGVIAYQRGIHDSLMRLAGGESTWANRYLEMVGFNPVERMNRLLAANAGIVSTEKLIGLVGKLGKKGKAGLKRGNIEDDLARRGVTNDDILKTVANDGRMPQDVADRIGFLASDATQHATHWKDIPLWWQSPVWRTAFQYKSFIYQQSRFAMREIMNPATKYFKTNGKKGSIAPLMRAAVLFSIGGTAVAEIRQSVRHHAGKLVGIDYEPPEFDEKHPVWELFQNSLYVGSLGMAGDLVERAAQRDLKGWLLGPTVGDLSDLAEGGIAAARAASDEEDQVKWHRLFAELQRRTPFVGTVLPRGRETTKKWEDLLSNLR